MAETGRQTCERAPRKRKPPAIRGYARMFKALADETRLEILAILSAVGDGETCVCDIESYLDLSQPTISHHLKVLREAQLVRCERRGTWVYYRLDGDTLRLIPEFHALVSAS